jgi:hypothetical protein
VRKKAMFWLCVIVVASWAAIAQTGAIDPHAATQKLGAYIGRWESEGAFADTPFSKAGKVTSSLECRWSPQGDFMVCEQLITDPNGKRIQLSIYSYNSKDGNYTISSMASPGSQPWNGTVMIQGDVWTYPGGFEAKGKKIQTRTTNDFSVPGIQSFKSEFSDDGGAHWTQMLQGKARKVAP